MNGVVEVEVEGGGGVQQCEVGTAIATTWQETEATRGRGVTYGCRFYPQCVMEAVRLLTTNARMDGRWRTEYPATIV